jgi:hypothetical protein
MAKLRSFNPGMGDAFIVDEPGNKYHGWAFFVHSIGFGDYGVLIPGQTATEGIVTTLNNLDESVEVVVATTSELNARVAQVKNGTALCKNLLSVLNTLARVASGQASKDGSPVAGQPGLYRGLPAHLQQVHQNQLGAAANPQSPVSPRKPATVEQHPNTPQSREEMLKALKEMGFN